MCEGCDSESGGVTHVLAESSLWGNGVQLGHAVESNEVMSGDD